MSESQEQIKPIARTTLTQMVVNQLSELVMKGVWKPGDSIPSEKELSSRFRVGRSTIREALQSLVVIGVLETTPGGRTIVKEPTSELLSGAFQWGLLLSQRSLGDLTEVRLNVEVECAGLAALRRNDSDVFNLANAYTSMIANESNEEQYIKYDNLFHRHIAESAKNRIYVNLVSTIQSLVRLWYPATYRMKKTMEKTRDEHFMMLEAIKAANSTKAQEAMRVHILSASDRLNQVLAERDGRSI